MGMLVADLEAANLLNEAAPEPEMLASFPPAVVVVWRSLTIRTTYLTRRNLECIQGLYCFKLNYFMTLFFIFLLFCQYSQAGGTFHVKNYLSI